MIELKSIQDSRFVFGQYFTPPEICSEIVSRIDFRESLIIEPSFGSGNFLKAVEYLPNEKIGIELDKDIFTSVNGFQHTKLLNQNFYDFSIDSDKELIFIGNPPYRTPARSLNTHKNFILSLTRKYSVLGIREEAVFFLLHTIDLIKESKRGEGEIHYILPKCILKNNSKYFHRFKEFLKDSCFFIRIKTIQGIEFDGVAQELVCLSLRVCNHKQQETVDVDGEELSLDEYLCLFDDDIIPFQKIFKRTYLGSVPCESLLMSVIGEPRDHFMHRLCSIIEDDAITTEQLYNRLCYNGRFHLKVFENEYESKAVQDKLRIILSYVRNIQEKDIIEDFHRSDNYKEINGRSSVQYYFRCPKLKRGKNFVYELNPNPGRSFFFTGNPSSSSSDYFGFCSYDINRNVSPGANRTVPVDNIEENLTDAFKRWWRENTTEPYANVFQYILFVSKSKWYKERKRNNKRFYFGIPPAFIAEGERTDNVLIPKMSIPKFFYAEESHTLRQAEFGI